MTAFSSSFLVNLSDALVTGQNSYTKQLDWIIPLSVTATLMTCTMWLLISLIHYGVKTKKWRKQSENAHVLNSGIIYTWVIVCAFMCIFRYIVSLISANVGFDNEESDICNSIAIASHISYTCVLGSVAMFLWCRQRAFYANNFLNANYNSIIKFISYISIVVIFISGCLVMVFYIIALNSYIPTPNGCVQNFTSVSSNNPLGEAFWITPIMAIAFYNAILLALLSYALISIKSVAPAGSAHELTFKRSGANDNIATESGRRSKCISCFCGLNVICCSSNNTSENKKRIVIQKTLAFAILSVVSDAFSQLFASYINNPNSHRRFGSMVFNVNSFLNLLFLILSFTTYKDMVMSPFTKV